MAYSFEFDSPSRTLLARFRGCVTDEAITKFYRISAPKVLAVVDYQGVINDFSGVTSFEVTPETVRALAWSRPAVPDPSKIRIIVAPTPQLYGLARMFAMHGEDTRPNLHIVRTLEHAYAILGITNPQFEPLEEQFGLSLRVQHALGSWVSFRFAD
jgi:hypothetical protein